MIENKGLKSFTSFAITDPVLLKEKLGRVREDQIARYRNEYILRDNGNTAPIRDRSGNIVAAISLSAFENSMSAEDIEAAIPAIQETARKVSHMAGYHVGFL